MKKAIFLLIAAGLFTAFISNAQNTKNDFLGMWTLDLGDRGVGWLGVNDNNSFLDADLLWRWGSVEPVSDVYLEDGKTLVVTRTHVVTKELPGDKERKHTVTTIFSFKRNGNKLTGVMTAPADDGLSVETFKFKGWKLPDVPPAPDLSKVKYGEPIQLFNGKDLTGWRMVNPNQVNGFKVEGGILVTDPVQKPGQQISYGNLRTDREFYDFNLKIEVNVPKHSNSGVYLRGMYEIQVFDSYGEPLDSHNMGALYSRITPSVNAEKPAGQWQSLDITLCDRHVTVILNGTKIIDNKPVYGPTGGAIIADIFKPGPIYLQGDHGKVSFRNIVLTPIIK